MNVHIRLLRERELNEADRVLRLAFGTFVGLPDPMSMFGDIDYVRTRWRTDPSAALAAETDGRLIGSNFAVNWGSVGFFGPLSVEPELWDRGVAKQLLEATMALFAKWGTKHIGLFTFAASAKHVALYQKFGFWPRFLTPVMSKTVAATAHNSGSFQKMSEVPQSQQVEIIENCRELTGMLYEGLDVRSDIEAMERQRLGETLLLYEGSSLIGLAVCHLGAGTEAGSDTCFVKFAAVRPGTSVARNFDRLLDACEALAAERRVSHLTAGVNAGRHGAYRKMIARGFRTELQGVAMHHGNDPGYNRPDVYALDDWR